MGPPCHLGEELVLPVLFLLQKALIILAEIVFLILLIGFAHAVGFALVLIFIVLLFFLFVFGFLFAGFSFLFLVVGFFGFLVLLLHFNATIHSSQNPRDTLEQ